MESCKVVGLVSMLVVMCTFMQKFDVCRVNLSLCITYVNFMYVIVCMFMYTHVCVGVCVC